jgi:prepilin signal peptidase PulO-like enzyme (type II secretory pathway)
MIITAVIIFILGAAIGSFINVLVERTSRGESLKGRSYCESCKKTLSPFELIPLLSYIIQKGKCKNCSAKLSPQYFIIELITALLFVLVYYLVTTNYFVSLDYLHNSLHITEFGPIIPLIYYLTITSAMIALFMSDLKYGMLYDKITIPIIIFVIVYKIVVISFYSATMYKNLESNEFGKALISAGFVESKAKAATNTFLYTAAGSIGIALFFLTLIIVTKGRGMGGGDLKLGFLIGLITGWPNMTMSLFLGFLTGAFISCILLLTKRKGIRQTIPFGPFLIAACFITMFFGDTLFGWYTTSILGLN